MPTTKPAAVRRGTCGQPMPAAGAVPGEGSAGLGKGTSVCRGPNNQPIHPNDCSIQDKLTQPSHNSTLQMTLFNQQNRFVLFLKANECSFGCRGLSCVSPCANKSIGIAEETYETVFAFSLPWIIPEQKKGLTQHNRSSCNCKQVQCF